ncbi:DNA cytosine methyltransferase [Sphingosinicella sp. LY1275]|uniref:DNA cytosine methyltransferase n=1 Tax=Sphingosinicella sp. LY1275 TaxID=3095379 RepID=UPI002ADECECA|nr:DNA cytosine methyltransferase [Sphingosinicella sp. LY1275]MEA1015142.1 DNA cytosine methyltransferase [Sphingosinicella sp. LY1275]
MSFRLIDLFCGAGGMSLGFADRRFGGGFTPILALDNDASAIATHRANFGGEAHCANIEEWLRAGDIPLADVVIGGPPCQGFSLLNKKRSGDLRRALWEPFIDIAVRSNARLFVMENVAELSRSPELQQIRQRAAQDGFQTDVAVLNAADYGSSQIRRRTIILGWRDLAYSPSFPLPTHASEKTSSNLPRWRTVRDAIADLPSPERDFIDGPPPLDLHIKRNPTAKSLARYKVVPEGGNRFDLQREAPELTPACWVRKKSGGTDLFGRLWWDRPSVTIRTEFYKPEKGRYLHPTQHRPITLREAARLMGFPDDFKFCGTKVEIARQIGNAVPPALGGAIARIAYAALAPLARTG